MRALKTIICVLALFALGCSKDTGSNPNFSSIKVLNTDADYLARSILTLSDGATIMGCVAQEDEMSLSNYGTHPALLTKYDSRGEFDWAIELPKEVYVFWKCILLSNGNILVVGFGDERDSETVGAVILNSEGTVLYVQSIFNQLSLAVSNDAKNTVDAFQLEDGRILLALPHLVSQASASIPRVFVLDTQLAVLADIKYDNLEEDLFRGMRQFSVEQAINGDIFISGNIIVTVGSVNPFLGLLKLNSSLDIVSSRVFTSASTPFPGSIVFPSRTETASNIALDPTGTPVFVSSLRNPSDSVYEPIFNLRDQEFFMRAPQLGLWHATSKDVETPINQISGFPANAIIQKIISTIDGGFIMVGTCGINTNQAIPSQYRMLVFKTDPSLNVQWMVYPQMQYATLGADIIETANGYLVAATQHSLGEINKPFFIRLNQSGIIE